MASRGRLLKKCIMGKVASKGREGKEHRWWDNTSHLWLMLFPSPPGPHTREVCGVAIHHCLQAEPSAVAEDVPCAENRTHLKQNLWRTQSKCPEKAGVYLTFSLPLQKSLVRLSWMADLYLFSRGHLWGIWENCSWADFSFSVKERELVASWIESCSLSRTHTESRGGSLICMGALANELCRGAVMSHSPGICLTMNSLCSQWKDFPWSE